ncbi:hypothetical protein SPV2_gp32 [Sulfolobus polyhedral virus 2]|uniref:Uncharacterized protein n=1 Tax=Sulfolobus polyhedral virus 2 TaxID=2493125 RepID=A0A3S8NFM8_9VIRU|nr:hypothetical protein KM458_gp32 [Sulfolobus polyhedral virus 2]AZI76031.1 hypothetical protein SPV2_gp32 [Sulfolobus polyhedral virus 2]
MECRAIATLGMTLPRFREGVITWEDIKNDSVLREAMLYIISFIEASKKQGIDYTEMFENEMAKSEKVEEQEEGFT